MYVCVYVCVCVYMCDSATAQTDGWILMIHQNGRKKIFFLKQGKWGIYFDWNWPADHEYDNI